MPKSVLEALFESKIRVKMLKLLFRNPGEIFDIKKISDRIQENPNSVKREISNFLEIGLVKTKRGNLEKHD